VSISIGRHRVCQARRLR